MAGRGAAARTPYGAGGMTGAVPAHPVGGMTGAVPAHPAGGADRLEACSLLGEAAGEALAGAAKRRTIGMSPGLLPGGSRPDRSGCEIQRTDPVTSDRVMSSGRRPPRVRHEWLKYSFDE